MTRTYTVFDNTYSSDDEYLKWVKANPKGYLINTRKNEPVNYRVLHRASCGCINKIRSNAKRGGFTQRNYIKICAKERTGLISWGNSRKLQGSYFSKECKCISASE